MPATRGCQGQTACLAVNSPAHRCDSDGHNPGNSHHKVPPASRSVGSAENRCGHSDGGNAGPGPTHLFHNGRRHWRSSAQSCPAPRSKGETCLHGTDAHHPMPSATFCSCLGQCHPSMAEYANWSMSCAACLPVPRSDIRATKRSIISYCCASRASFSASLSQMRSTIAIGRVNQISILRASPFFSSPVSNYELLPAFVQAGGETS